MVIKEPFDPSERTKLGENYRKPPKKMDYRTFWFLVIGVFFFGLIVGWLI